MPCCVFCSIGMMFQSRNAAASSGTSRPGPIMKDGSSISPVATEIAARSHSAVAGQSGTRRWTCPFTSAVVATRIATSADGSDRDARARRLGFRRDPAEPYRERQHGRQRVVAHGCRVDQRRQCSENPAPTPCRLRARQRANGEQQRREQRDIGPHVSTQQPRHRRERGNQHQRRGTHQARRATHSPAAQARSRTAPDAARTRVPGPSSHASQMRHTKISIGGAMSVVSPPRACHHA